MRMFICTTIKASNYAALTYKNHTIAAYKDGKLKVGDVENFSSYILDNLRGFIVEECYWVYRILKYPSNDTELKDALIKGIKDGLILCDKTM